MELYSSGNLRDSTCDIPYPIPPGSDLKMDIRDATGALVGSASNNPLATQGIIIQDTLLPHKIGVTIPPERLNVQANMEYVYDLQITTPAIPFPSITTIIDGVILVVGEVTS
jgi:hypothetical protein